MWKFSLLKKSEKFWHGVYSGSLILSGFVTLIAFQNCSKSLKVKVSDQASKTEIFGGQSVKCQLDGNTLKDQESNYFYSSQKPPSGKTCDDIKANRKCVSGQLTGLSDYKYSQCTDVMADGALVCNLDGVSAIEGSAGIFYSQQYAKSQNDCKQFEISATCMRTQNDQAKFAFSDGTYFGSCQAGKNCSDPSGVPGKSYEQGTEVIFSNISNPAVGTTCSGSESHVQHRVCNNGVFTGDATFMFADLNNAQNPMGGCVNPTASSCNKSHINAAGAIELKNIANGKSIPFFALEKQNTAGLCAQSGETFTCKDGVLSDSKGNKIAVGDLNTDLKFKYDDCTPNTNPKFIGAIELVTATETQVKVFGWACINMDYPKAGSDSGFNLQLNAYNSSAKTTTKMITLLSSDLKVRKDNNLTKCANYNSQSGTAAQFEFIINKGSDGIYSTLVDNYVQVLVTDNNTPINSLNLNHLSCGSTSCTNNGTNFYKFPNYRPSTIPTGTSYLGFLEPSYVRDGKTYFGGWACKKENQAPVTVSIYVKTDNGPQQIWTVEAKQERANFNNACGSGVASHGFEVEITNEMVDHVPGRQIFAQIYISPGNYSELSVSGVRPVVLKMENKPVGRLDAIGNSKDKKVSGWAYDSYNTGALVNVYFLQCPSSTGCASSSTNVLGIVAANRTFESDKNTVAYGHRFDIEINKWATAVSTPGDQYICAYATNARTNGENTLLGCQVALRTCGYYKSSAEALAEYVSLVDGLNGNKALQTYCSDPSSYDACVKSHIDKFGKDQSYCN